MKGIILAGGKGTRLSPLTDAISKQLLAVYDKPMVYYPLSVLMLAKINDILIITKPNELDLFKKVLGDGKKLGISLSYKVQAEPKGIAEAFIIGKNFIKNNKVCLILGDNIFYGQNFSQILSNAKKIKGACILTSIVSNPKDFGIAEFDKKNKVKSIVEKPKKPKSNNAITGLYFYNNEVVKYAEKLKPSKRGELEISDLNKIYLKNKKLNVIKLGRGFAWLDTGNPDSLLLASNFVKTIEHRQGIKIACLEEIALNNGWITKNSIKKLLKKNYSSSYFSYLKKIL